MLRRLGKAVWGQICRFWLWLEEQTCNMEEVLMRVLDKTDDKK